MLNVAIDAAEHMVLEGFDEVKFLEVACPYTISGF